MVRSANIRMVFCLAAVLSLAGVSPDQNATRAPGDKGFAHFSANVQQYLKVHNRAEKEVPKPKSANSPEALVARQRALRENIRHIRESAKRGDIFTPDAAAAFRRATEREFHGSKAQNARATIRQGEPLQQVAVKVNEVYPKGLPYTSVPPTLLQKFPTLPGAVAYRIVGHDLILLDVDAELVIDVMPDALP